MTKLNKDFEGLTARLKERGFKKESVERVMSAWEFAKLSHFDQKRLSGEEFVEHPLKVAMILDNWGLDETTIIAGLLHDTIEDSAATREDIVKEFGEEVAFLVEGVTNVTSLKLKGSIEENFVENLRKMILVMSKDLRVVLLKLADRLHNMETLWALPVHKQKANAMETLEIYAPLAERLGIGEVKGKLEDLAFQYVFPKNYQALRDRAWPYYKSAEVQIKKMRRNLLSELAKEGIKAEIHGRKKHLFSLWRKLERDNVNWDFDKVHDVVALRIIVDKIKDCYTALGVIHRAYKPTPHIGVSDFIAQPKPNGYRSIHTKVFGSGGNIVEVQIRTRKMHREAEYGIAAHWAYAERKKDATDAQLEKFGVSLSEAKLAWVKQLVAWQEQITDSEEFIRAVKFDAFKHRNFVFTPLGDVFDLPRDATPVDFAYAIHTEIGNSITGAKVDGKMVPLNYRLKSGEVVEIIKAKSAKGPSHRWLEFVVTTTARREINKSLRKT